MAAANFGSLKVKATKNGRNITIKRKAGETAKAALRRSGAKKRKA